MNKLQYVYNDGGRKEAGFKGKTGDCVVRAISIASGVPYAEVYKEIGKYNKKQCGSSSIANGVYIQTKAFALLMEKYGFTWVPCMKIGSGCKQHLADTLPMGTLIARVSKHVTAVINHVINDTFDPSRGTSRCVYGYWIKK